MLCSVVDVCSDLIFVCITCDACSWRCYFTGNMCVRRVEVVSWGLLCTQLQFRDWCSVLSIVCGCLCMMLVVTIW